MKRAILFVLAALVGVQSGQAEYQHIDLTVFGMD